VAAPEAVPRRYRTRVSRLSTSASRMGQVYWTTFNSMYVFLWSTRLRRAAVRLWWRRPELGSGLILHFKYSLASRLFSLELVQ